MNINPLELLKNAQKMQERLDTISATGFSGGGMVEIDLNGRMEMVAIRIMPEILNSTDQEMVQDLIVAAFSNGMEKVREAINSEMGGLAGTMGLQGFSSLFSGMQ